MPGLELASALPLVLVQALAPERALVQVLEQAPERVLAQALELALAQAPERALAQAPEWELGNNNRPVFRIRRQGRHVFDVLP